MWQHEICINQLSNWHKHYNKFPAQTTKTCMTYSMRAVMFYWFWGLERLLLLSVQEKIINPERSLMWVVYFFDLYVCIILNFSYQWLLYMDTGHLFFFFFGPERCLYVTSFGERISILLKEPFWHVLEPFWHMWCSLAGF